MDERIGQTVTVDGTDYRILRLLGKGKGGYSYLAEAPGGEQVTVKQIHHEPCAYYQLATSWPPSSTTTAGCVRRAYRCRSCWLWTGRGSGW